MKFLILMALSTALFACPQVSLQNLTCKMGGETITINKIALSGNLLTVDFEGIPTVISIPSTETDEDGIVSSYRCSGNKILADQSYGDLKANGAIELTASKAVFSGESFSTICDENSCEYSVYPLDMVCE